MYGKPVLVSFSENDTGFEVLASGDTSQEYGQGQAQEGNRDEHESEGYLDPDSDGDFAGAEDTEREGVSANIDRKSPAAGAAPAQPTRRICAICGKSLNALVKKQGSRYCSANCKAKARYQRKKASLHNNE